MPRSMDQGETMTIPESGSDSNVYVFRGRATHRGLTIFGPASLTGTATVYVYNFGADYNDDTQRKRLVSGGDPITVGAGDAQPLDYVGWGAMQMVSDEPQAADAAFETCEVFE